MSSASELKAYIIDDQRSMRSIIQMLLRQLGIKHITEAEDGAHALDLLISSQDRPDFILCDLYMENGDGIAFINSIRRHEQLRDLLIPVILLTGETDPMILGVGQQVGAAAILQKPCSAPALAKAISTAVGYTIT
jgi:CheY-like chemotaxis protein